MARGAFAAAAIGTVGLFIWATGAAEGLWAQDWVLANDLRSDVAGAQRFVTLGAVFLGAAADDVAILIAVAILALGTIGIIGAIVFVIEYVSTGFDGLALARHGRISASPVPPGTSITTQFEIVATRNPRTAQKGLRHSWIYRDRNAIEAISDAVVELAGIEPGATEAAPNESDGIVFIFDDNEALTLPD